ncbi:DUF4397 domain-containing protein [Pedobacter sp.]|uniref:DUF4397 domain-containing protein n=1 Tax=Pedobacter sp. TaxID=1411316 RepID=UPI00396CBBC6
MASQTQKLYIQTKALVVFLVLLSAVACKKNDTPDGIEKPKAKVRVVNAVQASGEVNFFLDDQKVIQNNLTFGESTGYLNVFSGERNVSVSNNTKTTPGNKFTFVTSISYTLFALTDKNSNPDVLILEDDLGAPPAGKFKLKLVNLNPTVTSNINVLLPNEELLVSSLPFKNYTDNFIIEKGTVIKIIAGSTIKTLNANDFEEGKNYLLWLSGTSNTNLTVNKLSYN